MVLHMYGNWSKKEQFDAIELNWETLYSISSIFVVFYKEQQQIDSEKFVKNILETTIYVKRKRERILQSGDSIW